MPDAVIVRPYVLGDRVSVRAIACETADRGGPVERFFPDRDVFADLVTRYYTDDEPQSTWVAESDGQLVGYVTGCLDTRRYWRRMAWRIVPRAVATAAVRGVFGARQTWRLLGGGLRACLCGGWRKCLVPTAYAAHLHVNVRRDFRGQAVGRRLVERFFDSARAAGVRGIHLGVRENNRSACRFFERLGFALLSRHPAFWWDEAGDHAGCTRVYGKQL